MALTQNINGVDVALSPEEESAVLAQRAQAATTKDANAVALACASIDTDADAIRKAVMGERATEYQQAYADAQAFQAASYTGTIPEGVQSWLDAKNAAAANWTAQQACQDILTTAEQWLGAQSEIRAQRLLRKELIRVAADQAGRDAQMQLWAAFVAQARSQLKV